MVSDRNSNTAILLFTRSELEEGCAKGFTDKHGTSSGAAIARSFIHHTRAIGSRTGYPVITVGSGYQEGHDFGERLYHAFQKVFDKGYSNVIAIGNDTPSLKTRTLRLAARRMESEEHNVVLGPAADGGTYLIGLSRAAFDPELFRGIPWCSGRDHETLFERTRENGANVLVLSTLDDVDDHRDLLRLFSHMPRTLSCALERIMGGASCCMPRWASAERDRSGLQSYSLRGPPVT